MNRGILGGDCEVHALPSAGLGGEEGSKKGFSCTANITPESEEVGGRGGRMGESKQAHIIFQLFPR